MEYDLQSALRRLSQSAPVPDEPVGPDTVMTRVRRRRAVRATLTATVGAAAALVTAVAVQAVPWQDTPPVAPSPTRSATAEPTPTRTPVSEPTAEPTETSRPVVPSPPLVALTDDGELVLLDPASGETLRVVAQDPGFAFGNLAVDRARGVVYLTREQDPGSDTAGAEVVSVSLADGTVEPLGPGWAPALSPDGTTLAHLGPLEGVPTYERFTERALILRDLASGVSRWVPDGTGVDFMRGVEEPTWSTDGTRVLVGVGWAGEMDPGTGWLTAVDPENPPATLNDADRFAEGTLDGSMPYRQPQQAFSLPDGRLVVEEYEATLVGEDDWTAHRNLVVLDGDDVEVRTALPLTVPEDESAVFYVITVSGDPAGTGIAVVLQRMDRGTQERTSSLWLWDGDEVFVELRQGIGAAAW